ncbi:curli assembly protein CsgF [Pelagibaculum spongiae]|uniref:Curli production assembly/transport component CsgF n=1 Tax=Pelagibaculum spongiae TaxID=2080658 RepID=A0A2V1GSC6_9GAMM|nr:curli assembly protein CsgF [Pelagibaculum spongiae]PVZ65777.1 curli production assembly protein CsgF [Pelagibaculum spongiae]
MKNRSQIKQRFVTPLLGISLLGFLASAQAGQLTWHPVNPNFGGSPLNGSQLLSNAQAQSRHKSPSSSGYKQRSALDRFTDSLESRLLSQLLTGVGDGKTGSLSTDDFLVAIEEIDGVLQVVVTDLATDETTIIEVNGLISD